MLLGCGGVRAASSAPLRVVLVGDSITGLSRNDARGFAHRMLEALEAVSPGRTVAIVALGGSGQSVGSWTGIAERSKTQPTILDVKGVDAHEELSKPADALVIMLGMNDALAPYVGDSDESLDRWAANYEALARGLRERVQPKVLALAGVTLHTEDPNSVANQLVDRMNLRVRALAEKLGGIFVETPAASKAMLRRGRSLDPEFRLTRDYVHPAESGHLAIAQAMLEGLGETEAAEWLATHKTKPMLDSLAAARPGISWERAAAKREPGSDAFVFRIRYDLTGKVAEAKVPLHVTPPDGWTVEPATPQEPSGESRLTGTPDRLLNRFTLRAGDAAVQGAIPAPWAVATGAPSKWDGDTFDPAKNHTATEEAILAGTLNTGADAAAGTLRWVPYFSSINFTGGSDPDSVDFAAVTHPANFEAGYGARWIFSEKARPVAVRLGSRIFAGAIFLQVWLNGREVYQGQIHKEKRREAVVPAELKSGWNVLIFKASHRTWQWQVSVGLQAVDGDTLDALRYRITPPPTR